MANGSNMKHLATPLEKANLKQGTSVMTDYGYDRSEIGRCFPVKLKNVLTIRETSPHGRATPPAFLMIFRIRYAAASDFLAYFCPIFHRKAKPPPREKD